MTLPSNERGTNPFDPTDERASDTVREQEDANKENIVDHDTTLIPVDRETVPDPVMPAGDATLNTQI